MKNVQPRSILTINRGSGTLKAALYEVSEAPRLALTITVDRAGSPDARVRIKNAASATLLDAAVATGETNADLETVFTWISEQGYASELMAAGHMLVHGGSKYSAPLRITEELLAELHTLARLDPDHTPEAIRGIRFLSRLFPELPQVACFDTAFHGSLPKVARMYALPRKFYDEGVRRYGFHGLSCEYIMRELQATEGELADGRVIILHLGSGSSMTAVRNGKSVDTSMGFTPLEGLVMGTRSGDVDPGAILYLEEHGHASPEGMDTLLNKRSGLLGVSGISADMRELLHKEANDSRAAEAIDLFCYRAKKYVGAYAAALGGLDVIVFSGGIGENSPAIRERICEGLEFLGIKLDSSLNHKSAASISDAHSRIKVRVIHTDEDWMILQHVLAVLGGTKL